jgi:hypothetical protein
MIDARRRKWALFGAVMVVALGPLAACGSCGESKNGDKGEEPDPSSARPFNVRWDGGRRFRPHRRGSEAGAAPVVVDDAGGQHDGAADLR